MQELIQEQNILSGEVLGFGYNTISIREDESKRNRIIHFDGLQKRLLSNISEEYLKRLKRIEFIDTEDWDMGINLFVCCDKCKNALFSLFGVEDFNDKNICPDCERWLCSICINEKGFCDKCSKKRILRNL